MARSARLTAQALAVALVVGLLALLIWRVARDSTEGVSQALKDGKHPTAPAFDLERLDGRGRIDLASLRGKKPIVLDFWASWCVPCGHEAPRLAASAKAHRGEVVFLGLDVKDFSGDARRFLRKHETNYVSVRDGGSRSYNEYGLTGLPETYFVDRQGRIVAHKLGEIRRDELESGINQALGSGT